MATNEFEEPLDAIRKRPAMYVGSTALFGFINYLVCPVALFLAHGAKRIDATVKDGFEIQSDVIIRIERTEDGRIAPFQQIRQVGMGHNFEATVLTALSEELSVSVQTGSHLEEWQFVKGVLASHRSMEAHDGIQGTTLRFKPDTSIFTVTEVSQAVFASYFRRLSFLHEGVRFALSVGGDRQEFFTVNGMAELFTAISAPYQLMHEPVHIAASEGTLSLQVVMAYHSWKANHLWCFINNGRAVEGGTHEQGFSQALKRLKRQLNLPEGFDHGVVAVASIQYPEATWEGCLKARIGNPELRTMVSRLVVNEVVEWLSHHPSVEEQIRQMQTFRFPEAWYGKL
ncbi:MAG: hypothetical protein H7Z41_14605 [Cytophagales bacterium]|nr:hypothetical protein [Armatimonadota bacterium]